MKIGIMTYWTSKDNYGQQLQCFALQKYLKKLGHDPYLIRYDPGHDKFGAKLKQSKIRKIEKKILYLYKIVIPGFVRNNSQQIKQSKSFEEFQNQFLSVSSELYLSYEQLRENPPSADVYMVGSDQVWNFLVTEIEKVENEVRAFMLDFGSSKTKRIAAAASWGRTEIPDCWVSFITPLLKKFDAITVREASGIELCRKCGHDATLVADPTLYLSKNDYRSIYRSAPVRKPQKPFVFVYWINNGGNPPMERIMQWAEQRDLSLEYVTANGMNDSYKKNYATIPEWLYLIDHAEYIITNSFHCSVFSMLFEKRFGVIKIRGAKKGMNNRIDNLFEICNVTPRYLADDDFSCLESEVEKIDLDDNYKLKETLAANKEGTVL